MKKSMVGAIIFCVLLIASVVLFAVTLGDFSPLTFTENQATVAGVDTVKGSDGSVLHYAIRLEGRTATLTLMPAYMVDDAQAPSLEAGDTVTFHLDSFYQSHYEADSLPNLPPSSLTVGEVAIISPTLMAQNQAQLSALIRTAALCTAVLSAVLTAVFTVRYVKKKKAA